MQQLREYTHRYFLTAGKCDASQHMPLSLIARHVIEVATEHANAWGAGYANLIAHNEAWVLSRLTIEMIRYPGINEGYELTTWVEGFNRHYSERNVEIKDGNGEIIGYVRSIWFSINITTRQPADLSRLQVIAENVGDRPCPIANIASDIAISTLIDMSIRCATWSLSSISGISTGTTVTTYPDLR